MARQLSLALKQKLELTPEWAEILGTDMMSRADFTKGVWQVVKAIQAAQSDNWPVMVPAELRSAFGTSKLNKPADVLRLQKRAFA